MKNDLRILKECCDVYNHLVKEDVYACEENKKKELRLYRYGSLVARGKVFCFNYIKRRITEKMFIIIKGE